MCLWDVVPNVLKLSGWEEPDTLKCIPGKLLGPHFGNQLPWVAAVGLRVSSVGRWVASPVT